MSKEYKILTKSEIDEIKECLKFYAKAHKKNGKWSFEEMSEQDLGKKARDLLKRIKRKIKERRN